MREILEEIGLEDFTLFESPSYETAIVGYDIINNRIIYDYDLMVQYLIETKNLSYLEAVDLIESDTLVSCPFLGNRGPLVMMNVTEILERYKDDTSTQFQRSSRAEDAPTDIP